MKDNKLLKDNLPFILFEIGLFLLFISANLIIESNKKVYVYDLDDDPSNIHKLVISEILTSNDGASVDKDGNLYDWIELYNGTDYDIDLTNYGLSDKKSGEVRWTFPETIIKSKSYIVVYLTNEVKEGLYTNFSLRRDGGEIVTLKSMEGKVIDSVETVELPKNNSMYRDSDGKWKTTNLITPGYENSTSGRELFLNKDNVNQVETIKITEILPSNTGNILFNDNLYGYIEITNISDETINLSTYYISNDEYSLYKWRLPDYNLKSDEVYLILMNGLDKDNNASFTLKKKSGIVYLSNNNGVVDTVEYSNITNGVAYIKQDDTWYQSNEISPGYLNNTLGKIAFQREYDSNNNTLLINEVMSSNNSYLPQNGNQYYDWIELYNNSNSSILLSDYSLSTNSDNKYMYILPEVVLEPNEYIVLMASGNPSLSNSSYYHTNFKLSVGEGLFLFKNDIIVDSLFLYNVPKNYSYGRGDIYGHYYYSVATPNHYNGSNGIREIAYTPIFNNKGGIYNGVSSIKVELEGSGEIYYTLDGSTPTNKSTRYTEPIDLLTTSVVRAISYDHDKQSSNVVTNSYIINEQHSLPVVSLSLKDKDYKYLTSSIYANRIVDAYIEYYDQDNNSSFTSSCGLKLFGGQSRELDKKSFTVEFGGKYSEGKLEYKLFDDKDITEFSEFVLRSGSQDQNSSMMRDEFISKMMLDYGTVLTQGYKPVVLYINGNYWGVYFIKEKINTKFIENNYNVYGTTNIVDFLLRKEDGDNTLFISLKKYIQTHDLSIEENYNYVSKYIDIDNIIDYYVYQYIIYNRDPHNVRFFSNNLIDNGRIKTILYDSDFGLLGIRKSNYFSYLFNKKNFNSPPDTTYLEGLLNNSYFRKLFLERMSYYMKNVWTEENILKVYNSIYEAIKPEMEKNCIRWNQSYQEWLDSSEFLKQEALNMIDYVPLSIKEYFNLTEEEYNEYFK